MTLTWLSVLPLWIVAPVLIALLVLLLQGTIMLLGKRIPGRMVAILALLRLAAIVVFAACLFRPVLNRIHPVEQKPSLLVLLDTSGSMGLAAKGDVNRLAGAQETLRHGKLRDHLSSAFALRWFAFDRDARPLTAEQAMKIEATSNTTDWATSLETAWNGCRQDESLEGAPPSRVLLVSDGNDCGLKDPVETARRLGAVVYTMPAPGADSAAATQALFHITGAQGPGRVLLGSECRFRVSVRRKTTQDVPAALILREDGQPVISHEFKFAPGEDEHSIQLVHRPTTTGIRHYAFHVGQVGDPPPATNAPAQYALSVQVLNRNTRVLILEDAWRWEFKYLRQLLEEDPSFTFVAFLARSGGTYMQFAEPDNSLKLGGFPQSRAELEWFDIFILGDVQPQRWPDNVAPALHELVVQRARSMIVIPGPRIGRMAGIPQMEALLPVQVNDETRRPVTGPVNVRVTREGRVSPFFYTPAGENQAAVWKDLPPLDQIYAPLRKKPAATILLETPDRSNPFGNLIVMAEHTVGRGRILYLGTDTLWKWHMLGQEANGGNTPYRLFWQQTLRALSPARQADSRTQLEIQTDRTRYMAGQTVSLRVTQEGEESSGTTLEAYVELPDQRRMPLAVKPDPTAPRVSLADFQVLVPGRYQVTAELFAENRPVADVVAVFDVAPVANELDHVMTDEDMLNRISSQTGGKTVKADDQETWPARAEKEATVTVNRSEPVDLWQRSILLLLLVALLAADWTIRLIKGYV